MRDTLQVVLLAASVAAGVAGHCVPVQAQTTNATEAAARLAGTWQGTRDGVPSVVLRVNTTGDSLQGEADFILLKKQGSGPTVNAGTMTVPMLNPHLVGSTLVFEILRKNKAGSPTPTTTLDFTLAPEGDGAAKLTRRGGDEAGLEVEMSRID